MIFHLMENDDIYVCRVCSSIVMKFIIESIAYKINLCLEHHCDQVQDERVNKDL